MIAADAIVSDAAAIAEVKAYLRIEGTAEDATIARLTAAAIGHGEAFLSRQLIQRTVRETVPPDADWRRLGATPARAITSAATIAATGEQVALAADAYAFDIDAAGDGWVRFRTTGAARRVQVTYAAGMAAGFGGLPEPIAQGIVRLAAHLYTHRDAGDEPAPPAAVAALWRPWRRMRLA